MKKYLNFLLVAILLTATIICALGGCKEKPASEEDKTDKPVEADGINADVTQAILITEESFVLGYEFDPPAAAKEVTFRSDSDAVTVDKDGLIKAVKPGEAVITVKEADGNKFAECKVIVGNIIIDSAAAPKQTEPQETAAAMDSYAFAKEGDSQTEGGDNQAEGGDNQTAIPNVGGVYGTTLFAKIADGCSAAKAGDVLIIKEGEYDESVTISKDITLQGVQNPRLKCINLEKGVTATLDNLLLTDTEFPAGGSARILAKEGCKLTVENCVISTESTEKPTGGYAVFMEKQGTIEAKGNTISNIRYGIYICPTDKEVNLKDNNLSNLNIGIGLDIRQENSELNYPTKGSIDDNKYNEVQTKTQFFHYGEAYKGDFDFKDNELENASSDEGQTGGQGMLE